mgnify:FL=1
MSKIEELIKKLCPNGVEYKTLGELGRFYGGITGKSKEDFKDGNAKFITYKNVYENISLKLDVEDKVKISEKENQRTLEYGDIIFTGSSETPNECGLSSVVTEKVEEKLYLNSFCFFFRMNNKEILNPDFAKHLFRSSNLRYQIGKTASGVTRFNVSKKAMEKVRIPVPPLEVQCEIVHILDDFTLLSAELSAELKARQKQYEYYNCNLLKFENIPYYTLEELCDIVDYRGKTPKKTNEGIFLVTAKNIRKGYIDYEKSQEFISEQDYAEVMRRGMPKVGDVLITTEAPCGNVAQVDDENIALAQRVIKYRPKDNRLDSTFLKYILLGEEFQTKLNGKATGGTVKGIKGSILHKLTIPLPSIEEQRKIVKILDRFNKLCNDISEGLPAEINARQKQYEYYRDKILTFKMIGD